MLFLGVYKLDFVQAHGLGGAMVWELSSDDASHTMIQTMASKLWTACWFGRAGD